MAKQLSSFQPSVSTKLYMPLNGNSVDISGNDNHGTDTAITYVGGKFGQGARFGGSSSDIGIPATIQSKGTLSLWFKRNDTTTGNSAMAGYTTIGVSDYLRINPFNNNTVNFTVQDESLNPTLRTDTFWHNAILTWDSAGLWYGYIDGSKMTTGSASKNPTTSGYLRLGITANGTGIYTPGQTYFNGIIDEVIIENRAWTPQEIATYYKKSMLNYRAKQASIFSNFITYLLTADQQTYILTGISNLFNRGIRMLGDVQTYTLTGISALFATGKGIVADVATFVFTGYDSMLSKVLTMIASGTSFALTGVDIIYKIGHILISEVGSFILSGKDIIIKFSGWTKTPKDSGSGWTKTPKDSGSGWTKTPKD